MHIIALDLGTKTGFAEYADGEAISEQWVLWKTSKHNKDLLIGCRVRDFQHKLEDLACSQEYLPDVIYYESVHRHLGTQAAHIYGALLGTLEAFCLTHKIRLVPVGVKQIKKAATGNGNASKGDMMVAAMNNWGIDNISEDEADALGLLWLACQQEGVKK